jgi:DNA-binding CsgD family transcriptional regulator
MANYGDSRSPSLAATPFVGRERELDLLRHASQQVIQGHGGMVLISGEAGIGKTALVRHLVNEAREQGAFVLNGGAYDLSATPPYGPWLEILQDYDSQQLNESFPDPPPFLQDRDELARMQSQEALFHKFFTFLSTVAEQTPLVLVLEDLHWSDHSSLDLLRFVARRSRGCPILIVATYRDDEVARGHALHQLLPTLIRETDSERVELRAFDEPAVWKLIEQHYQLDNASHERVARYLLRRAEGHPLFTIELMRTLEFRGVLRNTHSDWQLGDLEQETVPGLIQQIVDRRMAGFSAEAHTAMQKAAVIGHNVSFEDWALVTDPATVMSASALALESHLVDESRNGRGVAFHHALVREAIYARMVLPLRLKVHIQVAEAFLSQPDSDPEIVAYHLHRAGDPRAAEWLIRAGEKAESQLAFLEACERYKQAVEIVQRDEGNGRQVVNLLLKIATLLRFLDTAQSLEYYQSAREAALAAGERGAAAHALFRIGFTRSNLRDAGRGLENMRDGVRAMADAPEDVERIGRWFTISWQKEISSVDEGIGSLVFFLAAFGRYQEAIETAEQYFGVDWRESEERQELEASGITGLGVALANLGQPEVAEHAYRMFENSPLTQSAHLYELTYANTFLICLHFPYRTLDLNARQQRAEMIEGRLKVLSGMMDLANTTWGYEHYLLYAGRWTDLYSLIRSKEPPGIFGYWSVSMAARARFALYRGDYDHTSEILHDLLPEGPETLPGDNLHFLPGHAHRTAVELAVETGNLELAHEWIEAHDRWLDWSGAVSGRAEGLLLRGKIHLAERNSDAAGEHTEQALAQASDLEQPMALVGIHRFLGELATRDSDYPTAADHLTYSQDLADACALPFEQALTSIAIADLEIARGCPAEARARLADARRIGAELGARPALDKIASLAATLRPREDDARFGLTPREIDVLRHLVRGMSDKEIARELFISSRTVGNHVVSILRKLNVESRTAAAATAVREQLA